MKKLLSTLSLVAVSGSALLTMAPASAHRGEVETHRSSGRTVNSSITNTANTNIRREDRQQNRREDRRVARREDTHSRRQDRRAA